MPVVVVATITPRAGEADAVRRALVEAVPKVHAEPGCELYALHEGDGEFVLVERWESEDALAVHGTAGAVAELGAALRGKVAGPSQVRRLTAVPAGEPAKGVV